MTTATFHQLRQLSGKKRFLNVTKVSYDRHGRSPSFKKKHICPFLRVKDRGTYVNTGYELHI